MIHCCDVDDFQVEGTGVGVDCVFHNSGGTCIPGRSACRKRVRR
jgi:hypothetical protein